MASFLSLLVRLPSSFMQKILLDLLLGFTIVEKVKIQLSMFLLSNAVRMVALDFQNPSLLVVMYAHEKAPIPSLSISKCSIQALSSSLIVHLHSLTLLIVLSLVHAPYDPNFLPFQLLILCKV